MKVLILAFMTFISLESFAQNRRADTARNGLENTNLIIKYNIRLYSLNQSISYLQRINPNTQKDCYEKHPIPVTSRNYHHVIKNQINDINQLRDEIEKASTEYKILLNNCLEQVKN